MVSNLPIKRTCCKHGFYRTLPDILDIFEWMSWGVVMKYGAEIIVANEFHQLNFTCTPGGLSLQHRCYPVFRVFLLLLSID